MVTYEKHTHHYHLLQLDGTFQCLTSLKNPWSETKINEMWGILTCTSKPA